MPMEEVPTVSGGDGGMMSPVGREREASGEPATGPPLPYDTATMALLRCVIILHHDVKSCVIVSFLCLGCVLRLQRPADRKREASCKQATDRKMLFLQRLQAPGTGHRPAAAALPAPRPRRPGAGQGGGHPETQDQQPRHLLPRPAQSQAGQGGRSADNHGLFVLCIVYCMSVAFNGSGAPTCAKSSRTKWKVGGAILLLFTVAHCFLCVPRRLRCGPTPSRL